MDPNAIISVALIALNGVLKLIAMVKSQGGLTDDQIMEAAEKASEGNDAAYDALVAALKITPGA